MEGIRDAEGVVGSPIPIAAIEYVPDDSPYYEKYRSLAAYLAMCIAGAAMASGRDDVATRGVEDHFAALGEQSILAVKAAEIEDAIRSTGRWTHREEWRICTETEYCVEPAQLDDGSGPGFRAEAFCSFRFSSVSPTVDRALQFLRAYDVLIRNLFYWSHLGWPSWTGPKEP